jgi:DNA-binding GntR family transcriptional regulator
MKLTGPPLSEKSVKMTIDTERPAASLTEGAYIRLRNDLLACKIRPGEKIKINEVALRLGINLAAIREALSRLTADGLVIAESQRGFTAAPVSLKDLRDLTQARISIETLCLRSAMALGGIEWETQIVASFHRMIRTPEYDQASDGEIISETWARAHAEFHFALVAACDNDWLIRLRNLLYDQSERYRRLSIPMRKGDDEKYLDHQSAQERDHKSLMEAALSRDVTTMEAVIANHMRRTAELIESLAVDDVKSIRGR